jgi:hypothetical protein
VVDALFGTPVAEPILASVHVRAHQQAGHMNASDPIKIIKKSSCREGAVHIWVLDMIFRDDECRLRTNHAPANFTTIKHMALNLIRRAPGKDSLRLKRKVAAWDDDFLASTISR